MAATKRYRVTLVAGPWVAGRKVNPGDVLELTPDEAQYEVDRNQLELVGAAAAAAARAESAPRNMAIRSAPRNRRGR